MPAPIAPCDVSTRTVYVHAFPESRSLRPHRSPRCSQGFEPSLSEGKAGIHFLFLFDPEVGKDRYLKMFTLATGGQDVWRGGKHQTSPKDAATVFGEFQDLVLREGVEWNYLCIAPHAFSEKGLVASLKSDVGKYFAHNEAAALELGDNQLPEEAIADHSSYLEDHLKKYRQALMHASDAFALDVSPSTNGVPLVPAPQKRGIGYRFRNNTVVERPS